MRFTPSGQCESETRELCVFTPLPCPPPPAPPFRYATLAASGGAHEHELNVHGVGSSAAILAKNWPVGDARQVLATIAEALNTVASSLSAYLAARRAAFARFFFLTDADLLVVLACAAAPDAPALARHIPSLFAAVSSFGTKGSAEGDIAIYGGSTTTVITSLLSADGEELPLTPPPHASTRIGMHVWLAGIETGSAATLQQSARRTLALLTDAAPSPQALTAALIDVIVHTPLQAALLATSIFWTARVEDALLTGGGGLRAIAAQVGDWVSSLGSARGPLAARKRVEQALLEMLHKRDVVSALISERISAQNDFAWGKSKSCG